MVVEGKKFRSLPHRGLSIDSRSNAYPTRHPEIGKLAPDTAPEPFVVSLSELIDVDTEWDWLGLRYELFVFVNLNVVLGGHGSDKRKNVQYNVVTHMFLAASLSML